MYLKGEPLYPFGYGLSYTKFKYSNLRVSPERLPASGTVSVSVDVKNTGSRAGDEVVQFYTHAVKSRVIRPAKELRGFERISLQPGESKTVTVTVPAAKLAYYDEHEHAFVVEPGEYELMAGASSSDIRTRARVEVTP